MNWSRGSASARTCCGWSTAKAYAVSLLARQDYSAAEKVGREAKAHLLGLRWVRQKRIGALQVERAVTDAIERIVTRNCLPAETAALMAAMRLQTYLDLRAEAMAFLVNCMAVAEYGVQRALGFREG